MIKQFYALLVAYMGKYSHHLSNIITTLMIIFICCTFHVCELFYDWKFVSLSPFYFTHLSVSPKAIYRYNAILPKYPKHVSQKYNK